MESTFETLAAELPIPLRMIVIPAPVVRLNK